MKIREAAADDVDAIARLLADDELGRGRETPGDAAYARAFAAMAAQPGNVYLVAEEDGAVIGCLQFTVIHGLSRNGASRAQVEGVRVDAAHRGRGASARPCSRSPSSGRVRWAAPWCNSPPTAVAPMPCASTSAWASSRRIGA